MLGAFALGSVELGGLISTALFPFVPVYSMRLEGDIAFSLMNGSANFISIDGGMSHTSIDGGIKFI